ncbi:MAG: MarR family winged helix-turn-helix transcriptional regulator [Congregibacter sp.]
MLQEFGLTPTQFDVLSAIHHLADKALPKAIAERLVVTRANITGVLKRLQNQKLVSTYKLPSDSRSYVCALTPLGLQHHEKAQAASQRYVQAQLAPFSESEMKQVEVFMRRMHTHLDTLNPIEIARGPETGPSTTQASRRQHEYR